jgi:hypothetical protein
MVTFLSSFVESPITDFALTLALSSIYPSFFGIIIEDSEFAEYLKYGSRRTVFYNSVVEYLPFYTNRLALLAYSKEFEFNYPAEGFFHFGT